VTTADIDLAMTIFEQALRETKDEMAKPPAATPVRPQRAA
jgi:hypothetical protein